jgi:hypothetical protein
MCGIVEILGKEDLNPLRDNIGRDHVRDPIIVVMGIENAQTVTRKEILITEVNRKSKC